MHQPNQLIAFQTAIAHVLAQHKDYGLEEVTLEESLNRVLAEPIKADRDLPPFDRSTRDGIAINFQGVTSKEPKFEMKGMAQAGSPQTVLEDESHCIEVMTGAVVPKNADTVVMYEHLEKIGNVYKVLQPVSKGQNIHYQASDFSKGGVLLHEGVRITPAEIGVLASVGKFKVRVKKLPRIAVVATGNELVEVDENPLPHQIRKSNTYSLEGLLKNQGILAQSYHLKDDPELLKRELQGLLEKYDVILLSGGVSKGKFDFLPSTFDHLGVKKIFHKVLQRPGKPFWFGEHSEKGALIFAFPGNPVSTFANYHVYFLPWLNKTLGLPSNEFSVFLEEAVENTTDLTLFKGVQLRFEEGRFKAKVIQTTGSGDLLSLSNIDGFLQLNPKESYEKESLVPFIPTKRFA
nr:molybdopterin molybdotransferase MoeA [Allomuricauda sp.]